MEQSLVLHEPSPSRNIGRQRARVILTGTTIDEVRDVHAKTLGTVLRDTNRDAKAQREHEERACGFRADALEQHQEHVAEVAKDIHFH